MLSGLFLLTGLTGVVYNVYERSFIIETRHAR